MDKHLNSSPITILVSSCLTGKAVRYDGSDLRNAIIVNHFSKYFKIHSICPEIEIGLGVPRRPIQIILKDKLSENYILVDKVDFTLDYTNKMLNYAKHFISNLNTICGYIVKERSPSCGLQQTPRFSCDGNQISIGAGLFTEQITNNFPWLPVINELDLENKSQQDNFLERIYTLNLWNMVYKKNNQYDEFKERINHQLNLRGYDPYTVFDNQNSEQCDIDYLTKIMTILKTAVTMDMKIKFLNNQLKKYNIKSQQMNTVISQYQSLKTPLSNVIKEFQKIFKNKKIIVNSNYFYPVEQELKSRAYYFG